jgi:hypothetical protein
VASRSARGFVERGHEPNRVVKSTRKPWKLSFALDSPSVESLD